MKAFLMYKDQDFNLEREMPPNEQTLTQDLALDTLFESMALCDKFLFEVARQSIFSSLNDPDSILYRQNILKDCLKNSFIVRDIYNIAIESIEKRKEHWWGFSSRYPSSILYSSVEALKMLVGQLRKLKSIAGEHAHRFESEGFARFFAMLENELDDEYFARVVEHLGELKFRKGVLISAGLGKGNKPFNFVLHKPSDKRQSWLRRILGQRTQVCTFRLHPRDENGAKALSDLKDRGLNLVADALAQSAEHVLSFFRMLRTELAFYIGCLNLNGQLVREEEPTCFPEPAAFGERKHSCRGLYDVCLALNMTQRVVGSDVNADRRDLVIITGANQGGKSTFLRSVGLAQLMMQAGMFVAAESFCSDVCDRIFTHYRREEDTTMKSGKLDEELSRMNDIADNVSSNSMILFNESFSATNEREGSEIAGQITSALVEKGVKVFFVTHLYEFAHSQYSRKMGNAVFLRAERTPDGARTFKLIEGEPLLTSFGEDLYSRVFNEYSSDSHLAAEGGHARGQVFSG